MTLVKTGLTLLVGMTVLNAPTYATNTQLNNLIDVASLPSNPAQRSAPIDNLNTVIQEINESATTLGSAIAAVDHDLGGLASETTATRTASIQNLLSPSHSIKEGVIIVNGRLGTNSPDTNTKAAVLQNIVYGQTLSVKSGLKTVNLKLGHTGTTMDRARALKTLTNGSRESVHGDLADQVHRLNTWIAAKITAGTPVTFTGSVPAANLEALIAYLQTH